MQLPPDLPRHVLIAVNPNAGSGNRGQIIEKLVEQATSCGFLPQIITHVTELTQISQSLLSAGDLRCVIAAGGDGTIRLLADRLSQGTPLAILPLGTENLLAKYFEFSSNPSSLCQTLVDGVAVRLDAGIAGERLFTLMVGCGFDAEVVRQVHSQRTGNINRLAYLKPIWDSIRTYQYPQMKVTYEPVTTAGEQAPQAVAEGCWVFVVNLPRYAGGLSLAPAATGSDGLLDVCVLKHGGLWRGWQYLLGIVLGRQEKMTDCQMFRTKRLHIEPSLPQDIPIQVDGDAAGELPISIEIAPQRLTFLVSPRWAKRNPTAMITDE